MKRHCGPEDEFVGDGDKRCGIMFDDVDRSTICPHEWLIHMRMSNPMDVFAWIFTVGGLLEDYATNPPLSQ